MAWCRQATSQYLSRCCPRSMSPNGVTRPQCGTEFIWATSKSLHFLAYLNTEVAKLVDKHPLGRQWPVYLHTQHNGCWWLGDARSQGIGIHGIDLIILGYFGLHTTKVKILCIIITHWVMWNILRSLCFLMSINVINLIHTEISIAIIIE